MASSRPHLQAENVILSFDSRNATPSQLSDSWRLSNVHSYRGNAMFGSDSPAVSAKTGSLKGEHPGIPGKRQSGSLRAAMRSSPQRAVNSDDAPEVDGQPTYIEANGETNCGTGITLSIKCCSPALLNQPSSIMTLLVSFLG